MNLEKMSKEIYQIIDSFLVEAKDQNGNERSLIQLNLDRKLAAERFIELFNQIATEAIEAVRLELKTKDTEVILHKDIQVILHKDIQGYNTAVFLMEQKAKEFLENNF